ncbi:MAG: hypothetical protein M1816_003365 [Peltula sp. TS41687]|nr:MAG: hypothetical protein M1816_003365 [Peltula sp. TS41687]
MAAPTTNDTDTNTPRWVRPTAPPGSHTSTKTWVSTNAQEVERYTRLETHLRRGFPLSDAVPRDLHSWIEHRLAMMRAHIDETKRRVKLQETQRRSISSGTMVLIGPCRVPPVHHGNDNRGAVLAMPTIWCPQPAGSSRATAAAWPGLQEYKWEGDDRARSHFGRFLPLPRERGNDTVAWHQLRVVQGHEFDRVRCVPTEEDIAWQEMVDEEPREDLVLKKLWRAIEKQQR